MNPDRFKELLDELDGNSLQTLKEKNARYAQDNDCLHNFRSGAEVSGGTPAQACWGYMTKHLVALRDMVQKDNFSNREDFLEKCQDIINYIRFLWCIGNDCVSMHMNMPEQETEDEECIPDPVFPKIMVRESGSTNKINRMSDKTNCPICHKGLIALEGYNDGGKTFWCDDCNVDITVNKEEPDDPYPILPNFLFEESANAISFIENICAAICEHGAISLAEVCDLYGLTNGFVDTTIGWDRDYMMTIGFPIVQDNNNFKVDLARPKKINKEKEND